VSGTAPRPTLLSQRFSLLRCLEILGVLVPTLLLASPPAFSQPSAQGSGDSLAKFLVHDGSAGLEWTALVHPELIVDEQVQQLLGHMATTGSAGPSVPSLHALFQLRDGPRRRAIIQYFQSLGSPDPDVISEPDKWPFRLSPTRLTTTQVAGRQRAVALRALARMADPPSLAQVVSAALVDDAIVGWDPQPARDALLDLTDLRAQLRPLSPLLDPDQIVARLRPAALPSSPTPLGLAHLARQDPAAFEAALSRVARELDDTRDRGPHAAKRGDRQLFLARKAWKSALLTEPLWTLRLAALLSARLPAKVLRDVRHFAESKASLGSKPSSQLTTQEALLGRAARWALPIVNAQLGRSSKLRAPTKNDEAPTDIIESWSVGRWSAVSTRTLWALYEHKVSPAVVAALCSRFTGELVDDGLSLPAQLSSPSVQQLRLWVSSPDPLLRGGCAYGLSLSGQGEGGPLLIARYFEEDSAQVRCAITRTLRLWLSAQHPLLHSIATLDPDPSVRELAAPPQRPLGFALNFSPGPGMALMKNGQSRRLVPEADGFSAQFVAEL